MQQLGGVGLLSFSNVAIPIQEGSSGSPLIRTTLHGPVVVGLTEAAFPSFHFDIASRITTRVNDFIAAADELTVTGGKILHFNFSAHAHSATFFASARPTVSPDALDAVHAATAR